MQAAHAYAGSLNGRDLREVVRVEEFSLILIMRSNRVAFKDGQQSRHRASIVCESERALTRIDSIRAEDRGGLEDNLLLPLLFPAGDELALDGLGER